MRSRHIRPRPAVCGYLRAVLASALLFVAAPLPAQSARTTMPDSVREYVSAAMAAFRANSVHRDSVDWAALEDSVFARTATATRPADTWLALTWALRSVDRHSFVMPPPDVMAAMTGSATRSGDRTRPSRPLGRLVDGVIGLVSVPAHGGRNRPAYVDSLQAQLQVLDDAGVCGWVVDLRENTGGNMWPMLAGIGALLGAEAVGSFTDSPPERAWRYRDGRSWNGDSTMPAEPAGWSTTPPRPLEHAGAPVALLVGNETASSGEMVLLAFLGRPNVRSFGDSTAGFASANRNVALRDGATLVVTASYPRDRLGRRYALKIAPDELVPASDDPDVDAQLQRAVAWLRGQPACSNRK